MVPWTDYYRQLFQIPNEIHRGYISVKDKELKKDLDELKEMMKYVICQMQNLQSRVELIQQDPMLWVSEYDDCLGRQGDSKWS